MNESEDNTTLLINGILKLLHHRGWESILTTEVYNAGPWLSVYHYGHLVP
jgi:hypothetical protein